jgi:hypothetical protein
MATARRARRPDYEERIGPAVCAGADGATSACLAATPRRVARHARNAPHGPEHRHELTPRLRVGEHVRVGIV